MTRPFHPCQVQSRVAATTMFVTTMAVFAVGCSGRPNANQDDPAFSVSLASVSNQVQDKISDRDSSPKLEPVEGNWPPRVGSYYSDLNLTDQNGEPFRLSSLQGKVILLELVAIPCKGCQSFAGANDRGGYGGVAVQPGLDSIHKYAKRFGGVDLSRSNNVAFVQLLLYGESMRHPTQEEVTGWAGHFGMNRSRNHIVLRGDESMVNRTSYAMIPGFHLIDRNFVLRYDSSGHRPKHDLYHELLPALGHMTRQR